MRNLKKVAMSVLFAAGALAITASTASAEIVCNAEGECWHVHRHWGYHPGWGLVVHPDGWVWGPGERYVWREPPQGGPRGYWHSGIWIHF
jgi:hypothetical protein